MNQANNNFIYEVINNDNAEKAAECLAYMFFNFEPVTSRLGLEWDSYSKMVRRFCYVIATNGLCFIAIDKDKDKVAGVITSIDTEMDFGEKFANEPDTFYEVLEKLKPDIAMTSELEKKYLDRMNFKPEECLHLFQCGILPEYAGKHIASNLVDLTLEAAVKSGYQYAMVDCTSRISKKIFVNLGFSEENSIKYSDFIYNDEKLFAGIDGEYVLMVKKIK